MNTANLNWELRLLLFSEAEHAGDSNQKPEAFRGTKSKISGLESTSESYLLDYFPGPKALSIQ
jgi:hypothetical protein